MKKSLIIIGVLVLFVIIIYSSLKGTYNSLVAKEETVSSGWAQVENVYQRRADLIPNLVNAVKGAANFEKETLTQVIEARAKATSVQINADNLTPDKIQQFQQAQEGLGSALQKLMVVVERYPELKANQNFLELQREVAGSENRISVERRNFNATVQEYNTYLRSFPSNIIANMFNFEKKGYFQSKAGAENAPTVDFSK